MPLIDQTVLLRVADRAAYQYNQVKEILAAISAEGLGYYFDTVSATGDADVEVPLDGPYETVDDDFDVNIAVSSGLKLGTVVWAMQGHFNRRDSNGDLLQVGGWDGYLTGKDVRVSQYFGELFFAVTGYYMLANNVFSEGSNEFAQLEIIAGPVMQFTDGVNYGDGSPENPANGTYFAATQLKVSVVSMGAINIDVRLQVKDKFDNLTTIDVTIPGGSVPGTEVSIGTASNRFLDVVNASFVPSGNTGTAGDVIKVMNLKDRQVQL